MSGKLRRGARACPTCGFEIYPGDFMHDRDDCAIYKARGYRHPPVVQ